MISDLVNRARDRVESLGDLEPHATVGQVAEELGRWSGSLDLLVVPRAPHEPVPSHEALERSRRTRSATSWWKSAAQER